MEIQNLTRFPENSCYETFFKINRKHQYQCRGKSRPVRLGLFSPIIPLNKDLSSLYLPEYFEWSSRLRLQSFLWNRFAIQRKSWFLRKWWPCYGKSVSVVPFLYQLFDVFDDNASRNSNHYASADSISGFSIFLFHCYRLSCSAFLKTDFFKQFLGCLLLFWA